MPSASCLLVLLAVDCGNAVRNNEATNSRAIGVVANNMTASAMGRITDRGKILMSQPRNWLRPWTYLATLRQKAFMKMHESHVLKAADNQRDGPKRHHGDFLEWLFALGGGTGTSVRTVGKYDMSWNLQLRMRYQDNAVMVLLLMVYFLALFFGLSLTYWHSVNHEPVMYYADPRFSSSVSPDNSLENFIDSFNQSPKSVHLQVTGYVPAQDGLDDSVRWQGDNYRVAFTFALDLSPWLVRLDRLDDRMAGLIRNATHGSVNLVLENGVLAGDLRRLRNFLDRDSNDLATVELEKHVIWNDWEELATNIKHQIRHCGFGGVIGIHKSDSETIRVYKNKAWANFLHSRSTKVFCALSFIGWLIYVPYMWIRCSKLTVHSWYRIDVPINEYWTYIADKLNADGFESQATARSDVYPLPTSEASPRDVLGIGAM